MATYFIEVDTYWQNSPSYFVGPFNSKAEAEAWFSGDDWTPADNIWMSGSNCGGDIRDAWRIYPAPLSKTAARQRGMRRWSDGDERENVISPTTRPSAAALAAAVESLNTYAY